MAINKKGVVPKNSKKKKCVVLGFLFDKQTERILMVKTPQGKIYLPGGLSKCTSAQRKKNLSKYVCKKTGFLNKPLAIKCSRILPDSKNIIIYDIAFDQTQRIKPWTLTPGYHNFWLTPEEIQKHNDVTPRIKELISDLLVEDFSSIKRIA